MHYQVGGSCPIQWRYCGWEMKASRLLRLLQKRSVAPDRVAEVQGGGPDISDPPTVYPIRSS